MYSFWERAKVCCKDIFTVYTAFRLPHNIHMYKATADSVSMSIMLAFKAYRNISFDRIA